MIYLLSILLSCTTAVVLQKGPGQEKEEIKIVHELFRLRNEHKADSAEQYFADTVKVYMKYLRNVPKKKITQSDKSFWKAHPNNRFEITAPVQITVVAGITTATIVGKEYLDGTTFQYEKIEIKFDSNKKINSFRGFRWY
ncbi:MAG: hypothetical protein V9F01_04915 [Chitinophagaceae bacterium]